MMSLLFRHNILVEVPFNVPKSSLELQPSSQFQFLNFNSSNPFLHNEDDCEMKLFQRDTMPKKIYKKGIKYFKPYDYTCCQKN